MKRWIGYAPVILLITVALVACGAAAPRSAGGPAQDYAGLVNTLRAAGATVVEEGTVAQPLLSVSGTVLTVNGERVQTFEYATSAAAAADANGISADGTTACHPRTWMGIPVEQQCASADFIAPIHWYESGRLIVLYVGSSASLTTLLRDALGPQFAGAQ